MLKVVGSGGVPPKVTTPTMPASAVSDMETESSSMLPAKESHAVKVSLCLHLGADVKVSPVSEGLNCTSLTLCLCS